MKRFIKTILFFFLPIFAGLIVLECAMRRVPNDYTYKNSWLTENINRVHIWTFGSSHGLYGISPRYFSKPAFNSAHVSQLLKYDAFIFDKFIDRADSLEWVVLPVSYFTLTSKMEEGEEWWRIKNYCIYYDCPYHRWEPKYNLEVVGNPLPLYEQIKRVGRYWIKGVDDNTCDSLGFSFSHAKAYRAEDWVNSGEVAAKRHTSKIKNDTYVTENKNYLEDIIHKCQNKKIKTILLTTPTYISYRKHLDPAQLNSMRRYCDSLVSINENLIYFDMLEDKRFSEDDFYDADHLNECGAAKLTKILDEYITEH